MKRQRIAYLINQYPMITHGFIRREIQALEQLGFDILRISIQGWNIHLTDQADIAERPRTRYILKGGLAGLLWSVIRMMLRHPLRFFRTLLLVLRISRGAERPLPYHLVYLAEACRIVPWLQAFGATHLHAHFATNPSEIAMLANSLGGPPYSFTQHGQNELHFGATGEKIRRSRFTIAISSFGRSQLYRRVEHAYWPKVHVVHCGLDRAFYEVANTPLTEAPRLVCVGRLCEAKGQLLLIEAIHRLLAKGRNIELVLAGDGEMRDELEGLIAKLGLQQHIRITGWINSSQVREEIQQARGLILPSFTEGLPIVIMEAMSLRRTVLSTYVAGIPELVKHGETGWLFPAGSIEDMMQAIESFLDTPNETLEHMGEAAYQRVLQRHTIETEAAKLAALLRD